MRAPQDRGGGGLIDAPYHVLGNYARRGDGKTCMTGFNLLNRQHFGVPGMIVVGTVEGVVDPNPRIRLIDPTLTRAPPGSGVGPIGPGSTKWRATARGHFHGRWRTH